MWFVILCLISIIEGTTKVLKAITTTGSGSTTIKAITKPIQVIHMNN